MKKGAKPSNALRHCKLALALFALAACVCGSALAFELRHLKLDIKPEVIEFSFPSQDASSTEGLVQMGISGTLVYTPKLHSLTVNAAHCTVSTANGTSHLVGSLNLPISSGSSLNSSVTVKLVGKDLRPTRDMTVACVVEARASVLGFIPLPRATFKLDCNGSAANLATNVYGFDLYDTPLHIVNGRQRYRPRAHP